MRQSRMFVSTTVGLCLALTTAACGADRPAPGTGATSPGPASPGSSAPAPSSGGGTASRDRAVVERLRALEAEHGARLGVHALDTGSGREVSYRSGERFAFASTVKALAAGAVLRDLGPGGLSRRVRFSGQDLVEHSPVTELHVEDGMSVREVVVAAVTVSDNTAGNLLLDLLGGPAALDAALAEDVGDEVTDVTRAEPDLNTAVPGERRDTTTPEALATSLGAYVLGDVLPRSDRRFLDAVLRRTTTGDALIRAGVPYGWQVGDKTGSAAYGTRNDVAVLRPPGRAPVLLAIMTTFPEADAATDDALVAEATRIVTDDLD